jgi:hypothetical protein
MMRDGESFPLPTPAHLIDVNESGLWPTPRANDGEKRGDFDATNNRNGLPASVKLFPTPTKQERSSNQPYDATAPIDSGRSLSTFVRTFPTPTKFDATNRGSRGAYPGSNHHLASLDWVVQHDPAEKVGGALNPPWVEWLMGWPIEWTALQPLAMDRFRQWLHSHGVSSPAPLDAGPGIE